MPINDLIIRSVIPSEDPSPASYHLPRRPLNEKNSPMFTIGKRCFNEKGGGGRTSWEKEWFNSKNPYTISKISIFYILK
jgi:hypothetical protein